jgi:energy-coupling factor transporter ATP-binding protein EcfA2
MSGISRYELFRDIVETIPSTSTIAVIGRMRTGKSTFAHSFAKFIIDYYSSRKYTTSLQVFNPSDLENVERLENVIMSNSKDVNILIFDDLSFIVSGYNKLVRNFLNLITRIAHITYSDINYIFFIGHYSRAISPFLRASNVVVLTSISHPEIGGLKELFTLSSLYDYLYYYSQNPKRYIYLIKYHVYERIVDLTIETPKIEIPICKECIEWLEKNY